MRSPPHVPVTAREVTGATFRESLSHFCTGVTVITAADEEAGLVGFACQSFSAVSLDPPLVLFCPTKASRTWPAIERAKRFAVNFLAWDQAEVSATFGRSSAPGDDKFADVDWSPSPSGAPVIKDALTWLEAEVTQVVEAGDHYVVIASVLCVGAASDNRPLLFHRSRYSRTEAETQEPQPWFNWGHPDIWI